MQIAGQEVFENTVLKQEVFFIPDLPYNLPQYTIKQMANFYKSLYANWSDERFEQLAKTIKIDVNKKIHRLSKGMQRQVAFWLAFSTMPKVLLLDEPMDGLDPVMRHHIRHLIIDEVAERKMTVIISSHNLNEVEDIWQDYVAKVTLPGLIPPTFPEFIEVDLSGSCIGISSTPKNSPIE